MKKILAIIILLLLVFLIFQIFQSNQINFKNPVSSPTPSLSKSSSKQPENFIDFQLNNANFVIYFSKISGKTIKLIPNFEKKQSALAIASQENCQLAVNGGFYTTEGMPLGLFIADGKIYNEQLEDKNSFLNGFFIVDVDGSVYLEKSPKTASYIALQSGPFISQNKLLDITIDENARRVILIKDVSGSIYVAVVVNKESNYSGPTLKELPIIVFSAHFPFTVEAALNLDGGSASFYFEKDNISLSELTPVGSVICIK